MSRKTSAMPAAAGSRKYFFYGHRKPSQNRPVVRGGRFSNRKFGSPVPVDTSVRRSTDFREWNFDCPTQPMPLSPSVPAIDRRRSPLARYILDSLRRHSRWSAVFYDLRKLRRVPPDLVAEVLRSRPLIDPSLFTRFFHWAGKQKGFHHTFASYNAFAYALNDAARPAAADQLPELMHAQGKQPSEKQLEVLVRMHADSGRGLRLFHIYRKMRGKFGVKPRIYLYNRILDALIATGHLDLALSVYDDLKVDGLKEEAITFMILAKGFCRAGRMNDLFQLLERMRSELCKPDVFAYTALIKVLDSEGNMDGCLRVWEELVKDGVKVDVVAYSTMVSGLSKAGKVEKGYELFLEMKRKGFVIDPAVYGSLVEGLVVEGRVGDGCQLLNDMNNNGYRGDLCIYNSLIKGLCTIGRVHKARKLFQLLMKEGIIPSSETVIPMLSVYADINDKANFFQLADQLGELKLSISDLMTNFFSSFITNANRGTKALEVFEELKARGYCSVSIYNILIECLQSIKDVKHALDLYKEIKNSKVFQPDSHTYCPIISCFVAEGHIREACSCYNMMKENSWTPSVEAYCSLVNGLCKIGEIDAAITLVKDCLGNVTSGPMEFKHALTVINTCRAKSPEKVIKILHEIIDQNCPLEDIIYCSIIYGFCKYASSEEARKVLAEMRDKKFLEESEFIIYEELLNGHLKKATAALVISGLKFVGL
ncbi:pentatricopeptide repeat-containing protein At4g20740-like [Zingiber officinale]|uniref:PROP1-like PPR domain-containing protein n=1 Tax=Zingiber officinale TaxID=94328 RepID=A0A8J5KB87_ZINOF|nr:pentatricopeptide repeat-containing protein At4g20740-like [Zingiber officinale]XP_042433447.1 pentatricopeptide repeat-containing protein At4g20740-like [Zingiber officinale]XP_042433448.1 pentatricopeptide repeat-containing protein At4g20740-like [Zingiber officinale]XP_042433449.1 pentatricopeptide repeat-containing protein At4g20740-like [Zingiber officinale]XP_042433451.1 pentatricopeptide repeat-containing protein At4g20740-like [Zingiber officinale]XP_042433452.1 pentatricopeptide re